MTSNGKPSFRLFSTLEELPDIPWEAGDMIPSKGDLIWTPDTMYRVRFRILGFSRTPLILLSEEDLPLSLIPLS